METKYGNLGGWANRHCLLSRFPGNQGYRLLLMVILPSQCWDLETRLDHIKFSADHLKVGPTAGHAPSLRLSCEQVRSNNKL